MNPQTGDIVKADTDKKNRNDVVGSMGLMAAEFAGVEIRWRCDPSCISAGDDTPEQASFHFRPLMMLRAATLIGLVLVCIMTVMTALAAPYGVRVLTEIEGAKVSVAVHSKMIRASFVVDDAAGMADAIGRTASISPDVNDPGARNVSYDQLFTAYLEAAKGLVDGGADEEPAADIPGQRTDEQQTQVFPVGGAPAGRPVAPTAARPAAPAAERPAHPGPAGGCRSRPTARPRPCSTRRSGLPRRCRRWRWARSRAARKTRASPSTCATSALASGSRICD